MQLRKNSIKAKAKSIKINTIVSKNISTKSILKVGSIKKKTKYTLPKKRKTKNKKLKFIINKSNSRVPLFINNIQLNQQLKPKTNNERRVTRKLPQWTLRKTKFDHYISSKELMLASVKEKTAKTYLNYGKEFYAFIKQIQKSQSNIPSLCDILNNFDIFQLDVLIFEFLTAKFNFKVVKGGTLHNTACGILYSLAVEFGITLTCELLPGTRRICKGADNKYNEYYGNHPKGKYPILNPILEKMLDYANEDEQFALLIAQRFCLRSQHYCNNRKQNVRQKCYYLKVRDFYFIPDINNPRAICITTKHDKNNPNLEYMERVVYCCCKHTKWTCVVHTAQRRFQNNFYNKDDALLQCRSGDMYYRAMLTIVKNLIKKIGLDPKNYGTHSCRSGGTTELFLMGKQAIWIQNFGWWNNIGSVMIYIRPNNPDLLKFVNSTIEYKELREKEGGKLDKREKDLSDLQLEINKQNKKGRKGNRISKVLKRASVVSGTSNTRIQPMQPAPQGKIRTKHVYTQYNEHTYTWGKDGSWKHNRSAPPHLEPSLIGDIRIVTKNSFTNCNNTNNVGKFPSSEYNRFHSDWSNLLSNSNKLMSIRYGRNPYLH